MRRTTAALAGTLGLLAVADVARSAWVPSAAHFGFNVGLAAAVAGVAIGTGLGADELGLARSRLAAGAAWGAGAFAAIGGAVTVAALAAPGWSVFDDDRVDVSAAQWATKVFFVIPIGTVLLEELAYRGVLLALARRMMWTRRAVALSSVAFGLWHIPGAWGSADSNAAIAGQAAGIPGRIAAVAGTVLATTAAGTAFAWLRLRSGSLVAPALAHVATNSVVFTAAWLLA